jgi:hypothetical protein
MPLIGVNESRSEAHFFVAQKMTMGMRRMKIPRMTAQE